MAAGVNVLVRVSHKMQAALRDEAELRGMSVSSLCRELLDKSLDALHNEQWAGWCLQHLGEPNDDNAEA